MKLLSSKPFASVMLLAAMIALAVMILQPAHAGDLAPAFKADGGKSFTIKADDIGFACSPGVVTVTQRNGDARSFGDAAGTACTAVKNSPGFSGNYVQQVGTPAGIQNFYRATWIEAYCTPSGTLLSYLVNGGPTVLPDGCQTDAQIQARRN
jgi:hypothetical protein